jgi:tetratricopeptide (TPR) repeat protein
VPTITAFIKTFWNDPVWSKVIASIVLIIISIIGARIVLIFGDHKTRWQLIGMIVCGVGFIGCAVWYYARSTESPSSSVEPSKSESEKETLRTRGATRMADAKRLNLAGRNDQAHATLYDARSLYKQADDPLGEAIALCALGDLELELGRADPARAAYNDARILFKQVSDPLGEANVLRGLGDLESLLGRTDQARAAYDDARILFKQVDNPLGEAYVRRRLGQLGESPRRR